jgi:adenylate cyclase
MERKLTAILCADVYGYSRLMGQDEEATLRTLSLHRKIIDSLIEYHRGWFVNAAGDSVVAEFASVVNAVECAVAIQTTLRAENANLPSERRMEFRIAVNLGDVMAEGGQIYGDGVNVAARLESLADPGGICISGKVYDEISHKLTLSYEDMGPQSVKNIAEPVRVFRVLLPAASGSTPPTIKPQIGPRKYMRRGVFSLAGLAVIAATVIVVQHLSLRPPTPPASIPPALSPALPLPDKPSIAVLPFVNMSGDRDQEYFSDGITDDLITRLTRVPNLFVIARTSTFTYKGKAAKVQDIGHELGVQYVLEGSVRKAAGTVRITAQLVDATSGDHLWAAYYDRPLRDIFSLQDEIETKIATTLKLRLSVDQWPWSVAQHTDNLEAYDYYLRCLGYDHTTEEGNAKAAPMCEKAIELDPTYADAYATLGLNYLFRFGMQWSHYDPTLRDRAISLEQQAIGLDDSNALAHVLLGHMYLEKGQYDKGEAEGERAIALEPSSAVINILMAWILVWNKPAEALAYVDKAERLDPHNRAFDEYHRGTAYVLLGRYEEAVPAWKVHLASYPNNVWGHAMLAVAYIELNRQEEARAEAKEIMRINPQLSLEDAKKRALYKDQAVKEHIFADMRKAGLR